MELSNTVIVTAIMLKKGSSNNLSYFLEVETRKPETVGDISKNKLIQEQRNRPIDLACDDNTILVSFK